MMCEVRKDYQISAIIAKGEGKINRIEYMQLFNLLLNHFGHTTRYLYAIETKSLEQLGFIKVTQKLG